MFKLFFSILKKVFWQDKLAFVLIISGLIFNIIGWGILYWQIALSQGNVILHYNIFFGIDSFLTSYWQQFFASLVGAAIWFINLGLGSALYGQVMSEQLKEEVQKAGNRKKRYKDKDYFLDYFDAKRLASYLLWAGGLLTQLIILVYIAAIVVVNK